MAAQIRLRLARVAADFPDGPAVEMARRLEALPLLLDVGGMYALRPTGEVVSAAWDSYEEPEVEADQRIIDIALVQGTKRYPELSALLPRRPSEAPPCQMCEGGGVPVQYANDSVLREGIACWCGGLGWVPKSWDTLPPWMRGQ